MDLDDTQKRIEGEFTTPRSFSVRYWVKTSPKASDLASDRSAKRLRPSRCVTVEDKVASFDGLVAGEAGFVHCLVAGFAVVKLSETQAARRSVFFLSP